MKPGRLTLEVCLDSAVSAVAARDGGADRIELCASMADGGTTPSWGLIAVVRRAVRTRMHVLVRPRPGDFVYSGAEVRSMVDDVRAARDLGADGVVVGALTGAGRIDARVTSRLVRAAGGLAVTFHRAFDGIADRGEALETLVELGVGRVLTSGGRTTADAGRLRIGSLADLAEDRIAVMAGGGINARNVGRIVRDTGVREIHVGSAVMTGRRSGVGPYLARLGVVEESKVRSMKELLGTLE